MQPNFEAMTNEELRAYALAHRSELEPLRILFERRTPDSEAIWFHPPNSKEEEQQQFEQFKQLVDEKQGNTSNSDV